MGGKLGLGFPGQGTVGAIPSTVSLSLSLFLLAPPPRCPEPQTVRGTMGSGAPSCETEDARLQRCHRQAKLNVILKTKNQKVKTIQKNNSCTQLWGLGLGWVDFFHPPNQRMWTWQGRDGAAAELSKELQLL